MVQQSKSRYGFIDAIRGLAACSVMLQHALYQSGLLGAPPLTGFIPTWLELGEVGVVSFFLVSGFVIPLSLEKTGNFTIFWIHRALRIYPLYILIFCITIVLQRGGGISTLSGYLKDIMASLLFMQEYVNQKNFVGGSWTLSIEMCWYVLISTLFVASINKKRILIVILGVIISAVGWIVCALGHHFPMGRLSMILCCIIGLVCYGRDRAEISRSMFLFFITIILACIVLNLLVGDVLFPAQHPTSSFKMASISWSLAGLIFFIPFIFRHWAGWGHSGFSFLGRISYSVYLLHGVIIYLLSFTALKGGAMILVTFVTTISLSRLSYQFIELPPIRYGHSLNFKAVRRDITS
jgi:peptidoglycan/LPS O-acetylase OafA/YrhL